MQIIFLFFLFETFHGIRALKENSFDPATMDSSPASSSSPVPITNMLISLSPALVTTIFTMPNITQSIPTKLDGPADYLNLVSHFTPILKTHELMGFIDGNEPCPSKFVIDETGLPTTMVNPYYSLWQKNDQCLLS